MVYIYVYIFLLIFWQISLKMKRKKYIELFVGIFLICFFGLRGFIWSDWNHYYPNFNLIEPLHKLLIDSSNFNKLNYEIGYKIYTSIIKIITEDYHIFTLISSTIDLIFLYKIFKYYKINFLFGILLFLGFEGLVLEFDLLRNSKALLLYIYSIKYFDSKKYFKFFCINILAISFHVSVLINIILTPFLLVYLNSYTRIILFFSFILYKIFNIKLIKLIIVYTKDILPHKISLKATNYLNDAYYSQIEKIGPALLEKTLFFAIVLVFYKKIYNSDEKNRIILNSAIFYFFTYYVLGEFLVLKERLGTNFIYIYWLLIPIIIKESSKYTKLFIKIGIVLYILLRFSKDFVFIDDNFIKTSLKYENILFKHKTYNQRYQEFIEYSDYRLNKKDNGS